MEWNSMARNLPISKNRTVFRYEAGQLQSRDDTVVTEYALTIFVNGQEMATVVCSPEYMEELVLGFLASEGVVRSMDQVKNLVIHTYSGTAKVETTSTVNFNQDFYNKRYISSCCGKSRQSFYFQNDAQIAKYVSDPVTLHPRQVLALIEGMEQEAVLFRETGGVHMAGLCQPDSVLVYRTDIGRHNALDKLYGYVLRSRLALTGKVVTFSGRLSSEVLLKVAKLGVGMVIARSAPTALALDIADELNITTVGFARSGSFNIYTHPWRILGILSDS